MARTKGMKPRIDEWQDHSLDLGWVKPADLIVAAKRAGVFTYDLETTGLSPRSDRIEGVAFYIPPRNGAPELRAWYPFNPFTFMCHVKAKDIPARLSFLKEIGANMEEIQEQLDTLDPELSEEERGETLLLLDLRPAMDQEETMDELRPIWTDLKDVVCIAHHRKFDDAFIYHASGTATPIVVNNITADAMLADFCSDERRKRYGLKYRVKREFGHQMTTYKEAVRGQTLLSFCNAKPLGVYAMDDCYWTFRHHQRALSRLRKQTPADKSRTELKWSCEKRLGRVMGNLERIYWGIDTKVSDVLMEMENAGVLIDWRWLQTVEEKIIKEKSEISDRIEKFLGWPLNPNSGKQVADALFAPPPDGLGLPVKGLPIGKTGDPSTADKVIKHFARFHPLVADILKWRSLDTILTGFVKKLIKLATESPDGRVYAGFNQTRTVIARLSCVAADTLIDTQYGSIKISDLRLDTGVDYTVETHKGRRRRIVDKIYKGKDVMFEVSLSDGRTIKCTQDHKFLTPAGWRKLSDIEVGDSLAVPAKDDKTRQPNFKRQKNDLRRGIVCEDFNPRAPHSSRGDEEIQDLLSDAGRLQSHLRREAPRRAGAQRCPDSGSHENDGASCASEHRPLQNRQVPTSAYVDEQVVGRGHRANGATIAGIRGSSQIVLHETTGVLRPSFRDLREAEAAIEGYPVVWQEPRLLPLEGICEKESRLVYDEPLRADAFSSSAGQQNSPSTISRLGGQQDKRLLFSRNQSSCGSGRRLPREVRDCQGKGQAQRRGNTKQGTTSLTVYQQGSHGGDWHRCNENCGHDQRSIISIACLGVQDVWDITVEDDESYVAHGFINHNSSKPINFQNQPREKNLVRKAYVSRREEIDDDEMRLFGADYGQIELRVAAHLAQEANMIEVYQMGGICTSVDGGPCARYTYFKCHDCDHIGSPVEATPGLFLCKLCRSTKVEHQARCRHVDLHQRTADDAKVKRNPLAKNCVIGDSLVLTERGLLEIDEIVKKEGRHKKVIGIVGDDGKVRPTDSVFGGGLQKVARVEMEYGLEVTATYDHEFLVMKEGKIERIPVEKLQPGDPVLYMTGRDIHGNETKLPQVEVEACTSFKDVDLPTVIDAETARFLGYFVAEGRAEVDCAKSRYQIQFRFGPHDPDIVQDVFEAFGHLLGRPRVTCKNTNNVKRLTGASKKLAVWLEELGCGLVSGDKAVPSCIRRAPWKFKREFLRALFEGNGTIKPVRKTPDAEPSSWTVSYTSKSKKLVRQIQCEMMNIDVLGYVSSEWRDTDKGRKQYWVWTCRRHRDLVQFANRVGFISQRKQSLLADAIGFKCDDRANRFLDGVNNLLESCWDKTKNKQKTKLREVIRRDDNGVRFGDTRVELLEDVLPDEIKAFTDAGVWTAKIRSIEDAGEAEVYDLYEPERTTMVINSVCILDCNFGLLYRMGAPKFCVYADLFDADGMPMIKFAREIIDRWHKAYPGIAPFHEKTEWMLERNDWVAETLFGRRRRLDEEARMNRYRAVTQGIQFQVSGTAQDIMKTAMIRIYEDRNRRRENASPAERKLWNKVKILMQIHDEVVLEGPKQLKAEITEMIKTNMESIGKGHLLIPLSVDVKMGNSWDDIH